jgi:hypothetical protein
MHIFVQCGLAGDFESSVNQRMRVWSRFQLGESSWGPIHCTYREGISDRLCTEWPPGDGLHSVRILILRTLRLRHNIYPQCQLKTPQRDLTTPNLEATTPDMIHTRSKCGLLPPLQQRLHNLSLPQTKMNAKRLLPPRRMAIPLCKHPFQHLTYTPQPK